MIGDDRPALEITEEMRAAGFAVFELEGEGSISRSWLDEVYLAMVRAGRDGYAAAMEAYATVRSGS